MIMRWLCIEAHLLSGRYHGRSDEGRRAEWPPNPYRLFQALVAAGNLGFRRTEFGVAQRAALQWLERQDAPEIVAPPAHVSSPLRLYVPNNDMDKVARAWALGRRPEKQPAELRTDKDLRPHWFVADRPVRFLWPIVDSDWEAVRRHAEILCAEARHLHSLGLGLDLAVGAGRLLTDAEKRALPGEVWIADREGAGWRGPVAGSLEELIQRYAGQRDRVRTGRGRSADFGVAAPAPPRMYREVGYIRRSAGRSRPTHAFLLVDAEGQYRSFDARRAIEVAAWLRHAAHERAQAMRLDIEFVERFVCGHGQDDHTKKDRFSYLAAPTIPFKGRDGRIRRVLLAEPFGGGGGKAQGLARRLSGAPLIAEDTGEVQAYLRPVDDPESDSVMRRYLRHARTWGSATPVVLPGHDDRRLSKAHALVLKALAQAGYTTPVSEISLQREPVFPGAEMAGGYRVPLYLRTFPRVHAIITFSEAIPGPLAIGAGRHIGLGVFASFE
jgi:CRISPR-associated protein Csb2